MIRGKKLVVIRKRLTNKAVSTVDSIGMMTKRNQGENFGLVI